MPTPKAACEWFYVGMNRSRCQRPPASTDGGSRGSCSPAEFCRNPDCRLMFWICVCCDRGQRYCCAECRGQGRRRQHRAANRRYQQSVEGRLDHRDRQRAYRCRRVSGRVTDQGSQSAASPSPSEGGKAITRPAVAWLRLRPCERRGFWLRCMVCGRAGRLIDPFPHTSIRR